MDEVNARELIRIWAAEPDPVRIYQPKKKPEPAAPKRKRLLPTLESFKRRYGIMVILAAAFTLYTIILSSCVEASTEKRVWKEADAKYEDQLNEQIEAYKAEQAYQAQAEHWLSGDASWEAFLNQEIEAGAHFIAEEANETMKGTKLGVALARLMSGLYGSTLQEVINQADQWMNYSGPSNKFTQADRDFAAKMIRAYYEDGIIPDGLTSDIQWLTWTPGDYLARNNWNAATATKTWRYHG